MQALRIVVYKLNIVGGLQRQGFDHGLLRIVEVAPVPACVQALLYFRDSFHHFTFDRERSADFLLVHVGF